MRLIDADAFKEVLVKAAEIEKDFCGNIKPKIAIDDLIDTIETQPTVEIIEERHKDNDNGWIPITWRKATEDDGIDTEKYPFLIDCPLPDDDRSVLVCDKYGRVYLDAFCQDGYDCYLDNSNADLMGDIVAWQPLPAPYEEGNSRMG